MNADSQPVIGDDYILIHTASSFGSVLFPFLGFACLFVMIINTTMTPIEIPQMQCKVVTHVREYKVVIAMMHI